jgi:Tfp pilus assembly protein FimT
MFALGCIAMLVAMSVPLMMSGLDRSRGLSAARYLASRMALARAYAIGRSTNVALRFDADSTGVRFAMFMDGNGNGVRTADIAANVDPAVEPPVSLAEQFPGVTIAAAGEAGAPVLAGASRLVSFSPDGTATAGTIYVASRDGTRWAVRVLGTTARTRVLRYSPSTGAWVHAF